MALADNWLMVRVRLTLFHALYAHLAILILYFPARRAIHKVGPEGLEICRDGRRERQCSG